jgi:hypothetical protein
MLALGRKKSGRSKRPVDCRMAFCRLPAWLEEERIKKWRGGK